MPKFQLLEDVRRKLDDIVGNNQSYRWTDADIVNTYMQQAQEDMVRICRGLLVDSSTINEVLATGTITIAGASGSIDEVRVNGVVVTSGVVPFNATIAQTAADLAANITAFGLYTASATLGVVTISALTNTGATPNGYVVSTTTTTLTCTNTPLSGGQAITRLFTVPGQVIYELHPKVMEITRFKPVSQSRPISKSTTRELDAAWGDWENMTPGPIKTYLRDNNVKKVEIVPAPAVSETIKLTVWRMPLTKVLWDDDSTELEISEEYHNDLIPRILQYAFEKNDEETLRPKLSERYERQFYGKAEQIRREILRAFHSGADLGYAPRAALE